MKCAVCLREIKDTFLTVQDNFLTYKFFDSDECNIFCGDKCLRTALSVGEFPVEKEA